MSGMENEDPWAWMQPHDLRRFGEIIMDPKEQERWCRAVLLGGLPFMCRRLRTLQKVSRTSALAAAAYSACRPARRQCHKVKSAATMAAAAASPPTTPI